MPKSDEEVQHAASKAEQSTNTVAIKGKENILIWTDNALYSMKFVGAPFTFGFEQVGTNCGLLGQNAVVEIDGVAYWMGNNGFFSFDGTVNTLSCSVEDYVYGDFDTT